jgi:predicted nucleic acid-binding protein
MLGPGEEGSMKTLSATTMRRALAGKRLLIDSNIVIYLTDGVRPYEDLSRALFEMIERSEAHAVFSVLTVAEVMIGPMKKGLLQQAMDARTYLTSFPNSTCQEISHEVLEEMGRDERVDWTRLRSVDALIIASGLVNHIDRIVSNDEHFRNALPDSLLFSFQS